MLRVLLVIKAYLRRKEDGSKEFATPILVMGSIMELFPLCNDYSGNALERVQRVYEPADLWDITF